MARLILDANNLRKEYGERTLFRIQALRVYDGEHIGLIGTNGAGKSTLLRVLSGETEAEEGSVRRFGRTAMICQQGDQEETEISGELRSLFQTQAEWGSLSGGERTRKRIAAALSGQPNLLMADEPTTDLDEKGIELLYRQLEAFQGALILVSHDRTLLRRFCGRIWLLENGTITDFPGGYDAFQEERSRRRDRARFEYDQYQKEQKRLKESVQKMAERAASVQKAPSRMGNSEARLHTREYTNSVLHLSHMKRTIQNRMEQMEKKERPAALPDIRMKLGVQSPVRAKNALEVRCGKLAAGEKILLDETGMILPAGSRTALTGENGCGKTTILSAITGNLPEECAFEGTIRLNPQVKIGWFDQHHERTLRGERTVLENAEENSVHPQALSRTVLSCLGFAREDAFKPVSVLSGGERAKVALARLLLADLNLLILDEPTNHLDLYTMEALEELLAGYGGTILFVSHDETFLRKIATRKIRFDHQKLITEETGTGRETPQASEPENLNMEITKAEMRLADLSARMSKPRKGDKPEELNREYTALAEELRRLKNPDKR